MCTAVIGRIPCRAGALNAGETPSAGPSSRRLRRRSLACPALAGEISRYCLNGSRGSSVCVGDRVLPGGK